MLFVTSLWVRIENHCWRFPANTHRLSNHFGTALAQHKVLSIFVIVYVKKSVVNLVLVLFVVL